VNLKKYISRCFAFSLNELLIALSIVAIIGAIVFPQYIGLQEKARDVATAALADDLNHTYAMWVAAGGKAGEKTLTSDMLSKLSNNSSANITHDPFTPIIITNPDGTTTTIYDASGMNVSDSDASSTIRTSLPPGVDISKDAQIIKIGENSYAVFNGTTGTFSIFKTLEDAKSYVAQNMQSNQPQTITVVAASSTAFPGDTVTLTASGGKNAYSWSASNGSDSLSSTSGSSITVTLGSDAGNHTFSVVNAAGSGYLQSNTATAAITVNIPTGSLTFASVGTTSWTVPAGVSSVNVLVVGGGGSGGGSPGTGGGGGAVVEQTNYTVTAGQSMTVTVGAGGTNGSDGGASSFGSIVASGGRSGNSGGASGNAHAGGAPVTDLNNQIFGGGGGGAGANGNDAFFDNGMASNNRPSNYYTRYGSIPFTPGYSDYRVIGSYIGQASGSGTFTSPAVQNTAQNNFDKEIKIAGQQQFGFGFGNCGSGGNGLLSTIGGGTFGGGGGGGGGGRGAEGTDGGGNAGLDGRANSGGGGGGSLDGSPAGAGNGGSGVVIVVW
jgi:Tfp pilus assembly protein PilE